MPGLDVDAVPHVLERHGKVAGHAGDHRVGVAERHHGGGEMVAVLVDQPLAVAKQIALPLQPLVQEGRIGGIAPRQPRVEDLDALGQLDAGVLRGLAHALLAADELRGAEPLLHEIRGRANDLLLLAFREHHALGLAPEPLEHPREHAGDRIESHAQLVTVAVHVDDRFARHPGIHRGAGDRQRHRRDQPGIERHRNDVFRPVFRARAVGGGDLVGHVLARQLGQRSRGRDLHLHVDAGRLDVERAAEDIGKAQHVVDLVRVVGPPGRHDGVVAHRGDFLRGDLRIGIGHREDDRLRRHDLDHLRGDRALGREAEENVGACERFGEAARLGLDRVRRLPLVHALLAAAVDHAFGVAQHDVLRLKPDRPEQLQAGDAGGTGAVAHQLGRADLAPGEVERIEQPRRGDDGRPVLVVVEDRDVEQLAQPLLDQETFRRLDVLEIDAAESLPEVAHAIDESIGILGRHFEIDRIHVREALEQHRLAFHHRLGRKRAAIAQAEDGRAIGDDGDEIALGGVIEGAVLVFGDGQDGDGDAG